MTLMLTLSRSDTSVSWLTSNACRVCEVGLLLFVPSFRCHWSYCHMTADALPSPAQGGVPSGSFTVHNLAIMAKSTSQSRPLFMISTGASLASVKLTQQVQRVHVCCPLECERGCVTRGCCCCCRCCCIGHTRQNNMLSALLLSTLSQSESRLASVLC